MKIQKLSSDELNTVRGGGKSAPAPAPAPAPSSSSNPKHPSSGKHNHTFIWAC